MDINKYRKSRTLSRPKPFPPLYHRKVILVTEDAGIGSYSGDFRFPQDTVAVPPVSSPART